MYSCVALLGNTDEGGNVNNRARRRFVLASKTGDVITSPVNHVHKADRGTTLPNPAPVSPISSNIIRPLVEDKDDVPTTLEIGAGTKVSPLTELPSPVENAFKVKEESTEIEHCNDGDKRAKGKDPFNFERTTTRVGALFKGCSV